MNDSHSLYCECDCCLNPRSFSPRPPRPDKPHPADPLPLTIMLTAGELAAMKQAMKRQYPNHRGDVTLAQWARRALIEAAAAQRVGVPK